MLPSAYAVRRGANAVRLLRTPKATHRETHRAVPPTERIGDESRAKGVACWSLAKDRANGLIMTGTQTEKLREWLADHQSFDPMPHPLNPDVIVTGLIPGMVNLLCCKLSCSCSKLLIVTCRKGKGV